MTHTRSISLALRRIQLFVLIMSWTVVGALGTHVVVWSLTSFTDLRYGEPEPPEDTPLVVKGPDQKQGGFIKDPWRKRHRDDQDQTAQVVTGFMDGVFDKAVTWTRGVGLLGAFCIVPMIALGIVLSVQAGASRAERAVTALLFSILLGALALPLGGWFGIAWHQGTLADYQHMTTQVEAARSAEGFAFGFYLRYMLLPLLCALGFAIAGVRFSGAVEDVIVKGIHDIDPEIEREASNVKATSLHGTGRTSGALRQLLDEGKAAKKKPPRQAAGAGAAEMPKRLI